MATLWTVTFDAADPHRLAAFWRLALGYVDEEGYDYADGASLVDPDDRGPSISFLRVPEPKIAKNRVHLDVRPAGDGPVDPTERDRLIRAKIAELTEAGATLVRESTWEGHVAGAVMTDPEGNEFCLA